MRRQMPISIFSLLPPSLVPSLPPFNHYGYFRCCSAANATTTTTDDMDDYGKTDDGRMAGQRPKHVVDVFWADGKFSSLLFMFTFIHKLPFLGTT